MKPWLIALGLLLLAPLAFLTGALPSAQSSAPNPGAEKTKVIVQKIMPVANTRRLLVPARVEARVASSVVAEAEGFVTVIKKPLGSKVKAGEVVLLIKNQDPVFTYASVPVRSPVAGVVSQFSASLMSRVAKGDKLFTVIDPRSLKVSAEIPGAELALLEAGARGTFKLDLNETEGSPVRVQGVSPLMDPRTGTASAELEFVSGKEARAVPAIGSVGHALFEMDRGQHILIPESALGYVEGKPMVRVLENGVVKRKAVELGEQRETSLVVKAGLVAGDTIVVRSNRVPKEGEAVDAEEPKTTEN